MSSTTHSTLPRTETPKVSGKPGLSKVLIGSLAALGLVIALLGAVVAYYATGQADDHVDDPGPVSEPHVFTQ